MAPQEIFVSRRNFLILSGATIFGLALDLACGTRQETRPTILPTSTKLVPTPTQEAKEKESISSLALFPIRIEEASTADKFNGGKGYPYEKELPESGWKYVYTEFGIENRSNKAALVMLNTLALRKSILRTKEGFQYAGPIDVGHYPEGNLTTSTYFGSGLTDRSGGLEEIMFNNLPPGFRALGVFSGLSESNNIKLSANRITFKVGEKTSGYRLLLGTPPISEYDYLSHPNLPRAVPFPELDITNGVIDTASLKFPTNRPDSEFKNLGTVINVPSKGSVLVERVMDRTFQRSDEGNVLSNSITTIRFRFHNESAGYGQKFNLAVRFFGNDGILYTKHIASTDLSMVYAFPEQFLYWDGYPVLSNEVPPGADKIIDFKINTSSTVKNGKLAVSGDINEIFNLELPTPR